MQPCGSAVGHAEVCGGGGRGLLPGPRLEVLWCVAPGVDRSFHGNPFECFAVIESVTRFECFTVTEFFTVIECFTVTGTQRSHWTGEIVWSNEGASVRISSH